MRKVLIVTVLVAMVITVAIADSAYILCRPDDYVNVREFPSTKSASVGHFECGDEVETYWVTRKDRQGRTWVQIDGLENGGWVCSLYIQDTPVEVVEECVGYVASRGRLAVRRAPNGKVVKWIKNGFEVRILAMSDEWALTTIGYVMREYLDVVYDQR